MRDRNFDVDDKLVDGDGGEGAEVFAQLVAADEEPRGDIRDAQGRAEVFPPQQTETGAFLHDSGACVRVFAIYKRRVLWYNDGRKESGQECWI